MDAKHYYLTRQVILYTGVSFFVVLVLMSCAVKIVTAYYQPSAISGTNVRAIKRQPATNSVMLFEIQGVIVGMNTFYQPEQRDSSANKLYADISFEIPEGKIIELLDYEIEVFAPTGNSWKSELSGKIWTGPGRAEKFPRYAPMIGRNKAWRLGTAQGYGNTKHAAFFFSALLFEGSELETLQVKIPKFLINGFEVEIPIITLELDSEDIWTSLP